MSGMSTRHVYTVYSYVYTCLFLERKLLILYILTIYLHSFCFGLNISFGEKTLNCHVNIV